MELSSIFYIIEDAYFEKWFGEIDKTDEGGHLAAMQKSESLLMKKLSVEDIKIFENYMYSASSYYEIRLFKMCEKVLTEGIKIGMALQKIISEE